MKTMIIVGCVGLLITIFFVYIGVSELKKDAKEKGSAEKGYDVWSVVSGSMIGFFVILYEIVKEVFFPSRRRKY